jgi:hypothetical protein
MKITREDRTRPLITLTSGTGGAGGAPSGQVPISTGSNGGVAFGSNVSHIYSNGSNHLLGPFVNFASGAGIAFAVSSNTLTISATGGGSGGGDHPDTDHDFLTVNEGGGELLSTVASSGTTETIDLTAGNVHDVTLTDDCTFTFASVAAGRARSFTLLLRQGASPPHLATWPGSVVWAGGVAPTLSTTLAAVDVLTFFTLDGGTIWYGFSTSGGSSVGDLDDLTDVTITSPLEDDDLRYNGSLWVNDARKWEAVTNGEDIFVWDGDDLVHDWST